MGQQPSQEIQERFLHGVADVTLKYLDDFSVDSSLQRFSGLNSAQELNSYRDQVLYSEGLSQAASVVEKVGSALGGFASVPHAVGLGALIVSLVLDVVAKSLKKQTLGTAEMLERVFAQEKSREVRDLMDMYLKRMQISLRNPQQQLAETRLKEKELFDQLTRLKNSMLQDGHMDPQFLKQWVNGAAFHTQMLIHQARLERRDGEEPNGSRAMLAAGIYQQELNLLVDKLMDFLRNNDDSEGAFRLIEIMRSKPQISWTQNYFSNLRSNIPSLVRQNANFHIRN